MEKEPQFFTYSSHTHGGENWDAFVKGHQDSTKSNSIVTKMHLQNFGLALFGPLVWAKAQQISRFSQVRIAGKGISHNFSNSKILPPSYWVLSKN